MNKLKTIEKILNKISDILGYISMFCLVMLVFFVFYNVCARYFFHSGNVAFQELEWHFFAIMFMLGMSYTLKEDAHVRVDVFYESISSKNKTLINMFGVIFFIIPFALLVLFLSPEFVTEAYVSMEKSADPGGLSYRWIIKSFIPISFALLIVTSVGYFIKNLNAYIDLKNNIATDIFQNNENSAKGV